MPLITATVKAKQQFTEDVIELEFETSQPFHYQAGQFITFKIADKMPPCFRAYSISVAPKNGNNTFATCLKVMPGGRGSNWLNSLNIGDKIDFLGPSGKLVFQTSPEKSVLLISTGTGITPMKAIIEDQLNKGNKQKMHLIFGLRYVKDVFYKEHFENLAKKYPNFTVQYTLSRPENDLWNGSKGRVTEILNNTTLDPQNTEVYMCGLKDMILEVTDLLKSKGFDEKTIHDEKYN